MSPDAYFADMVKPHTHVDELFLAGLACVLNSDLVIIYLHPRPGLPGCKIIVASPDFKHDDGKRGANLPIFLGYYEVFFKLLHIIKKYDGHVHVVGLLFWRSGALPECSSHSTKPSH